jgi:hypothetical protein
MSFRFGALPRRITASHRGVSLAIAVDEMDQGTFAAESGHHAVQFYSDDQSLCAVVTGFLYEGLKESRPAVVIATPEHRLAIVDQLNAAGIYVDACIRAGALTLLDAEETLSLFMVDGTPDKAKFKKAIGGVLARVAGEPRPRIVRAYGEMVDVLWRRGQREAAIHLEVLWNELAMSHTFSLLCGYSQAHVTTPLAVQTVCNQHTHVLPVQASLVA